VLLPSRVAERLALAWLAGACAVAGATSAAAHGVAPADLSQLSIEELGDIQVTSVSKRAEPVSDAPSAIFVITRDDILRSGATSIPEMLRLAPNLQVAQTSASGYVITARGFNGSGAAQNFSNKLLVMIDGRSVYTPLYSGVYWDMQDVPPQDIDRIEVISGPGATLWGANAVNGVINITTRKSSETQGFAVEAGAGDFEHVLGVRYGGKVADDLTWRVYARGVDRDDTETSSGAKADDNWSRLQGGFRVDWSPGSNDAVTLQGDAYRGRELRTGTSDEIIKGRNLLARWSRSISAGSEIQIQGYYDRTERSTGGEGKFALDTYDIYVQHSFQLGKRHNVVWGGGFRSSRYMIDGTRTFYFTPPGRTLNLGNLFIQDSVTLSKTMTLILGLKVEDDPYVDAELLPSIRLAWKPVDDALIWAAVSRAVRSPTPFDRDVVEVLGPSPFLVGGADFQPERVVAYELGVRVQPSPRASFSVSAYYNDYDDLRSIEITPAVFLPLQWGNGIRGHTYGLEAWANYRATPWWRLSAGFNTLHKRLEFKPHASGLLGLAQSGDDPKYQASLKSSMDLGRAVKLDAALRYVSAMPDPRVPSYVELNGRLAWNLTDQVQVSLSGYNLLHDRHQEYPQANAVPRSLFVDLRWGF
jgi:iron complex outermembrane receptor protein